MEQIRETILNAHSCQIVSIVKPIDMAETLDFFAKLNDYSRAKNCCLFESREYFAGSTALSFGTANPALYLTGTGCDFFIQAISTTGRRMIKCLLPAKTGLASAICLNLSLTRLSVKYERRATKFEPNAQAREKKC